MMLILDTKPVSEPISLEEAKAQLRVESSFTDDDVYIESLIGAARDVAETLSLHAMMTQTWKLYLDEWPEGDVLELPKPPLQSVTEIKYTDEDGNESTLATTVYSVDTNHVPGRIFLKPDQEWPSTTLYPYSAIYIKYVCGWVGTADVPLQAKQAMKLLITEWYENREPVLMGQGNSVAELPRGVDSLLFDLRCKAVTW